jgi:membrane-associated phospholipid phosphatase
MSDPLLNATTAAYFVTAVAAPSGDEPAVWLAAKAKGMAAGVAAAAITGGATGLLKEATGRRRPDGSDRSSFPSGHASSSAVRATLAARNIAWLPVAPGLRTALQGTCVLLAAGTAWSRVEGRLHYPSDVLAGAALGHFLGAFIDAAFLGDAPGRRIAVGLRVDREGAGVSVTLRP